MRHEQDTPATADELDDARCPGCGGLPRTLPAGWLFRCEACDWNYGHPQAMDRVRASIVLHALRTGG